MTPHWSVGLLIGWFPLGNSIPFQLGIFQATKKDVYFGQLVQNPEDPNMIFVATAVDFEIKSIGFQPNWLVIGATALIIVAAWFVFLFIRKG